MPKNVGFEVKTRGVKNTQLHRAKDTRRLLLRTHHVTLSGVDAVSQALDSDPLDGHLGDAALAVVVSVVDLLGEAEVRHTNVHVLIQP